MYFYQFISNHSETVFTLAATGIFAGILSGLLGVGGGIVIVPVLFYLFQSYGVAADSAMLVATATSLATIGPTSISSIRAHQRKGNVDVELLRLWVPFIVLGVLAGSMLVTRLDGSLLTALFAMIATISALNMLFRTGKSAWFTRLPGPTGQRVMGGFVGFFSAMVGIGGGTISVPLLTLYNYPAHKAVGTAAAIGLFISVPGTLTMLLAGVTPADAPLGTYGLVNVIGFMLIVPLSVLCAPFGAALAARLNATKLKQVFAVILLLTGLRMFASTAFW